MSQQSADVRELLEAECRNAHAVSLTQASCLSATQRANERSRIRDVILSMPSAQVLQHIGDADASESSAKRMALLLYSLSSVLPHDTMETMNTCQERLQAYMVAVMQRIRSEAFARFAALVCRVAKSAMAAVGQDCASAVIDHVLHAIAAQAPAASLLIELLPVALSQLCRGCQDADDAELRQAKAQQTLTKLCTLPWPAHLVTPILAALRGVQVNPQQEQQLSKAAFKACARIGPEYLADAAYHAVMLSPSSAPVPRLQGLCQLLDDHRARASAGEAARQSAVSTAHAELLCKLETLLSRDKTMASSWLKEFKKSRATSVTALALTVTAVGISRSSAAALDAIKGVMLSALKHAEAVQASSWLSELHGDHRGALKQLADVLQAVVQQADESAARSLVQVGLHLMAAGKLKDVDVANLVPSQGEGGAQLEWWTVPASSAARLCLAGVALLGQVRYSCARPALLSRSLSSVLANAACLGLALHRMLDLCVKWCRHCCTLLCRWCEAIPAHWSMF
jgi:FANCI solenoid 1